jgi:hypothetical protein
VITEKMKILIFTEGTILMHENGLGRSRDERVRQVVEDDPSTHDFRSYVPIDRAVDKIGSWQNQGCVIQYLTSRTNTEEINEVKKVLKKNNFPEGALLFRGKNEDYKDVVERSAPDILIEDDCESIGGAPEMTITHVSPEIRKKIKSITVEEFGGIDHLPDDVSRLVNGREPRAQVFSASRKTGAT